MQIPAVQEYVILTGWIVKRSSAMHPARAHQKGFTLVEVVVSSVILLIAIAGVLASASALRRPAVGSDKRSIAALYGKQILDDLRTQIEPAVWNELNGPFATAINHPVPGEYAGINFSGEYEVFDVTQGGNIIAKRVDLRINWP